MEQENKVEKLCCIGSFLLCVLLFTGFVAVIGLFCAFVFLKVNDIKESRELLVFLLASFGIVLLGLVILCIKTADSYIKCKKIAVLKEMLFDSEITETQGKCESRIIRKTVDREKYKAFANAVSDI